MATTNKLKYISPAKEGYEDLGVEILDLHKSTDKNAEDINLIKESVKNIDTSSNSEIVNRIVNNENNILGLQGDVANINETIESLSNNHINTGYENVSINKEYIYDVEGKVIKEIFTGDMNRYIIYNYNENDLVESEIIYENGIEIGRKVYKYNSNDDVYRVVSSNGDSVNIAVMDYAIKNVTKRLEQIESNLKIGPNSDIDKIYKILQDMGVQIEIVTSLLPENITSLVDIPRLLDRMDMLEEKVNRQHIKFKFTIIGGKETYVIPKEVTEDTSIFLEGLLLDYGDDYIIENETITFNIPLIDGFEVQCKY